MGNVLSEEKKQQVIALGRLGWTLRRIQPATGVRRETAGAYLKAAGIPLRPSGRWGRRPPAKPANEVTTDSGLPPCSEPKAEQPAGPTRSPTASACEPYREAIELGLSRGRNAMAIWQDLVSEYGFASSYNSVKRFVRQWRGSQRPEACAVIVTTPGEEAQVDYGMGPMVRDPDSGKYRRSRLFVLGSGL
jgi:transposase